MSQPPATRWAWTRSTWATRGLSSVTLAIITWMSGVPIGGGALIDRCDPGNRIVRSAVDREPAALADDEPPTRSGRVAGSSARTRTQGLRRVVRRLC